MITWTLGEVRLGPRVSLEIKLSGGGVLEPADVLRIARLLEWIAVAVRKWKREGDAEAAKGD